MLVEVSSLSKASLMLRENVFNANYFEQTLIKDTVLLKKLIIGVLSNAMFIFV